MKVFTSNDFEGYWSVGTAAVVIAEFEGDARKLLEASLAERKLPISGFTLVELPTDFPLVSILNDGGY
jgi:hypothetical protein